MIKCMHFNSVYNKVIFKVLIMRSENATLNKGVALSYNFVAVYPNLVKNSPRFTSMKN